MSRLVSWWTSHEPLTSPLLTATGLGLGVYGLATTTQPLVRGALHATAKALRRPFERKLGRPPEQENDEMEDDDIEPVGKKPAAILGGLASLAALYHFYDPRDGLGSLLHWHKTAGLDLDGQSGMPGGYVQDLDWKKPISLYEAAPLFGADSHLKDDPYTRRMGISILSSAAQREGSAYPTTGSIYDSAVQKLNSKLTVGGVIQTGVRTVVANGLARLFTGALGTMVDLDKDTRDDLVSAGTWAGAISSILR